MFKKIMKKKEGFTLIELIAVIAVIAILATVMMPKFTSFRESAYKSNALSTAKHVQMIAEAYEAENGAYPDNTQLRAYAVTDIPQTDAECLISTFTAKTGEFKFAIKAKDTKWYEIDYDGAGNYEKKAGVDTAPTF